MTGKVDIKESLHYEILSPPGCMSGKEPGKPVKKYSTEQLVVYLISQLKINYTLKVLK